MPCLVSKMQGQNPYTVHFHKQDFRSDLKKIRFCNPSTKRVWHEIFDLRFFSWISVPQAPKYSIGAVLNFFENSRRYSQINVYHRCQRHRQKAVQRCQRHRRKIYRRCQRHRRLVLVTDFQWSPVSLINLSTPVTNYRRWQRHRP